MSTDPMLARVLIDEHCIHTDGIYRDKRLGLWDLQALSPER